MKKLKWQLTALAATVILAACNTEEAKKNKACGEYYDTVKDKIAAKQNQINSILDSIHDYPAPKDPALIDASLRPFFPPELSDKDITYSKLAPLNPSEVFICGVEEYRNIEGHNFYLEDHFAFPEYKKDLGTKLTAFGEKVKKGNADCYLGTIQNYFQRDIEDYTGIKYLAVTDCIFYSAPGLNSQTHFNTGFIMKKITLFDLKNASVADNFIVIAKSSDKISVARDDYTGLNKDLVKNFSNKLYEGLFKYNTLSGLNHYTSY